MFFQFLGVNGVLSKVMASGSSNWSFEKGIAYSQGKAVESLTSVSELPVRVVGTTVTAFAGFDLSISPEVLLIAYGTPHKTKDKNIYNAIKVKGRVKSNVDRIQKETFEKALTYELDKELLREWNNG